MPQTDLGTKIEAWSASAKAELRLDLDTLAKVPLETLRTVVHQISKTYPCCSPLELAEFEAEVHGLASPQDLTDAVSGWTFVWDNIAGSPPKAVAKDLIEVGVISEPAARVLTDLMIEAEPFREAAYTASKYLRIGSPLFVELRGTVDIRCIFHRKSEDFAVARVPTELVSTQQVIIANLELRPPGDVRENTVISFLMDETDLNYMKRFVRHMEREFELSKNLSKPAEPKNNG